MKIEIETKYNVGDIVWFTEWNRDDIGYRPNRARISGINLQIYDKDIKHISYYIGDIVSYSDKELFATEDEAEAECIRLNYILDREKRGE